MFEVPNNRSKGFEYLCLPLSSMPYLKIIKETPLMQRPMPLILIIKNFNIPSLSPLATFRPGEFMDKKIGDNKVYIRKRY